MSQDKTLLYKRFISGNESTKELDLRKELDLTLFGSSVEVSKMHEVLLRVFRRDEYSRLVPCKCNVAKEGSSNPRCPHCLGEGYLWDEKIVPTFRAPEDGIRNRNLTKFYFKYDSRISISDKIIELGLDKEGSTDLKNLRRARVWAIAEIEEKRGDYGRVEFYVAFCNSLYVYPNPKVDR
jgi:hypothetical protein